MSKRERLCWGCGIKRPSRHKGWWTFMGWRGPKGKRKLYLMYGCPEHIGDEMSDAWEAYVWGGWTPKPYRQQEAT